MLARIAAFAVVLAVALPIPVHAADAKPLRTLVFSVAYSITSTSEHRISGLGGGSMVSPDSANAAAGPTMQSQGFAVDDSGTMVVDVVAATADKGLVVDVSYSGKTTTQPPIRVAILSDGRLGFDPKKPICDQALQVLPLLARGAFSDRELSTGVMWTVPFQPPLTGTKSYRVTGVTGADATFAVSSTVSTKGPQAFDEHSDGTLQYATDIQVPRRWDVQMRAHHFTPEGGETTDTRLTATLQSDTLGKT
jgi:hypothetical protein